MGKKRNTNFEKNQKNIFEHKKSASHDGQNTYIHLTPLEDGHKKRDRRLFTVIGLYEQSLV